MFTVWISESYVRMIFPQRRHLTLSADTFGEGNGNPLQYCCLENPRDRGAWWAAVHGVAQSRTRLKRLSSSSSRHLNGLPGGSAVKNPSNCNAGDAGSIPGLGRSPAEGNGYPLQYYWPPNRMDRGTDRLQCMGLQKSQT